MNPAKRIFEDDERKEPDSRDQENDRGDQGCCCPTKATDDVTTDKEHHQDGDSTCEEGELAHEGAIFVGIALKEEFELVFPGDFHEVNRNPVGDNEKSQKSDILGASQITRSSLSATSWVFLSSLFVAQKDRRNECLLRHFY